MVNQALINPESIAILGASNSSGKPGYKLVRNLIDGAFQGSIYPVNPHERSILNLTCYNSISQLPETQMAILALAPTICVEAIEELAVTKSTKAFIIISAGFAEMGPEGRELEGKMKELARQYQLSIIGPNCIGVLNSNYKAIFVSTLPEISSKGVDFVSASGALAVFLFEQALEMGIPFNSIFSVGNSASIGIEEILEYWDVSFQPQSSSYVKLVYAEQIKNPVLFFRSVNNLRKKGCQVIVMKPGESEAAARAAFSHTGALAGNAEAYKYLIQKSGAISCTSREELLYLAGILLHVKAVGKRFVIITHAGGPAVLAADQLQKEGFLLPEIDVKTKDRLSALLFPGSSANNPIDMLATGTKEQLQTCIQVCNELEYLDRIMVIFGKTGLDDLFETYNLLDQAIKKTNKPVYSVLPSVSTGVAEIKHFIQHGHVVFNDEVVLARCLGKAFSRDEHLDTTCYPAPIVKAETQRMLSEEEISRRLGKAGIPYLPGTILQNKHDIQALELVFPVVAKVSGVIHKTEVNGVILNIRDKQELLQAFTKLIEVKDASGVMVQSMLHGTELYMGGKKHPGIGYSVHAGVGGIFLELTRDIVSTLAPVDFHEALHLFSRLKGEAIFEGYRNMPRVDKGKFANLWVNFSRLFSLYPDILEIDLNPLIAEKDKITAVDARIIVEVL